MDVPATTKVYTLNDGNAIPCVGLGTSRIKADEMSHVISSAIEIGYRHFDSAQAYANTAELGKALKKQLSDGKIKREDIFITTKESFLAPYYNRGEDVKPSLEECLRKLQLDYVDLFLIHGPIGFKKGAKDDMERGRSDEDFLQNCYEIADHQEIWTEMEKLVDAGLTKSIGVSNFNKEQLSALVSNGRIKPAVFQTECHAYLQENELLQFCHDNKIILTAYSPLGSPGLNMAGIRGCDIVNDEVVTRMAQCYNKSPAQILLRFHIQRDIAVVPKSSNIKRLKENINIYDFDILPKDMEKLSELDRNHRMFNEGIYARNHPQNPYPIQRDTSGK